MNVPSFLVRVESAKNIDFALNSPYNPAAQRSGRVKRKNLASKKKKEEEGAEDEA